MKYTIKLLSILLTFSPVCQFVYANENIDLRIYDPWIREAPPNAKVLAAYMVIENHTNKSFTITGVSSVVFEKIEIHQSSVIDDMMRMEKKPALTIKAKQKVLLEPGGIHLMLFNPRKALRQGDTAEIIFQLKNGNELKTNAKIKKRTANLLQKKQ